jgi:hypothetical protein
MMSLAPAARTIMGYRTARHMRAAAYHCQMIIDWLAIL